MSAVRVRLASGLRTGLRDAVLSMLVLALLSAAALILYVHQFAETNAHIGIVPLDLADWGYWSVLALWLGSLALVLPLQVKKPSDIFLCIYVIATGLWSAAYWPVTGLLEGASVVVLWFVLMLPAVAVKTLRALASRVRFTGAGPAFKRLPQGALVPAILLVMLVTFVLGYRVGSGSASFDFDIAFERRLSGRDEFAGSVVTSYLLQMCTNGLVPFLAFLGMVRRSKSCVAAAFGFAVFCFWLQGVKSPFVSITLLAILGHLYQRGRIDRFSWVLVSGLAGILLLALVELCFADISVIAEFGIRRVILVSSTIQAYFVHALVGAGGIVPSLAGIDYSGYATPEYFIGATYMANELTNANTNAFLHELASRGLIAYLLTLVGTATVLIYLDSLYARQRRPEGFAIAAILGLLLVEQAFTIAIVSSGVLLCMILVAVFSRSSPPQVTMDRILEQR